MQQSASGTGNDSNFSVPWERANLLNTPTYIASDDFLATVEWHKVGNQKELMIKPDDPKESPTDKATCAVVGVVSGERLFVEPHGNFNPKFNNPFESAKAQFQIKSARQYPEFDADFTLGIRRLEQLQVQGIMENSPKPEHFIVVDNGENALRFSTPLFEKRVSKNNRLNTRPQDLFDSQLG
jgi:hypothetical protein